MNDITVDELYDYILRDSKKRSRLVKEDIQHDLLPADIVNKELLAKHPEVFDYNPDTEVDHIDAVLGTPDLKDKGWEEDAAFEQLPEKLADTYTENKAKAERQDFDSDAPEEQKKMNMNRNSQDAIINMHNTVLDRILTNVRNSDMSDEQKKLFALRMLYNNSTKGFHKVLPDIKLSQGVLREALADDPIWSNPDKWKNYDRVLNAERINTDYLPLTYDSDKLNYEDVSWDENGNEHREPKTEYLFHPNEDSLAVYNIFVNNLLGDILSKNSSVKDPYSLAKYISDKYTDAVKVMTYDDWEKEFAKLDNNINEGELERRVRDEVRRRKEQYGEKKWLKNGISDEEVEQIRDTIRAAMSEQEVDPESVVTPDDFIEDIPDNPRLRAKSAEEKAKNRTKAMHGDSAEAYERYEKAKQLASGVREPKNEDEEATLVMIQQEQKEAYEFVNHWLKDYKWPQVQKQYLSLMNGRDKLQESLANIKDKKQKQKVRNEIYKCDVRLHTFNNEIKRYYYMLSDTPYGIQEKKALANSYWNEQFRNKFDITDNAKGMSFAEKREHFNENKKYKGPDSETNKKLMKELDSLFSTLDNKIASMSTEEYGIKELE